MQFSILNTCIAPLLPLLPVAMLWAWLRAYPRTPGAGLARLWIALCSLVVIALAVLRVSRGTYAPLPGEIGLLQALWIVTTHPAWFLLGLLGFVQLMVFPVMDEERRRASRILIAAALATFALTMLWFIVIDPNTTAKSFTSFVRFTPLNLSVGVAFVVAAKFLQDEKMKDRQISVVTLLMIALFIGGVGAMVFSDL